MVVKEKLQKVVKSIDILLFVVYYKDNKIKERRYDEEGRINNVPWNPVSNKDC